MPNDATASGSGSRSRSTRIMDDAKMERTIARLALEIVEQNKGTAGLVLIGIRNRGVPLAKRLAEKIAATNREKKSPPVGAVDITLYRDDLTSIFEAPMVRSSDIHFPIDGSVVVLVDDVLFTGRTIRAAIDTVMDYGRPKAIRLAVMIDRGHRELPIQADYVGKVVPTRISERVDVLLVESDGADEVVISEASAAPPPAPAAASPARKASRPDRKDESGKKKRKTSASKPGRKSR